MSNFSLKTNNNLQTITQKTKDRATRTPQKQTMIYKTLHRKLKIEQHVHHKKQTMDEEHGPNQKLQ